MSIYIYYDGVLTSKVTKEIGSETTMAFVKNCDKEIQIKIFKPSQKEIAAYKKSDQVECSNCAFLIQSDCEDNFCLKNMCLSKTSTRKTGGQDERKKIFCQILKPNRKRTCSKYFYGIPKKIFYTDDFSHIVDCDFNNAMLFDVNKKAYNAKKHNMAELIALKKRIEKSVGQL